MRIDEQIREVIRKHHWRLSKREIDLSYKLEQENAFVDEELFINVWDNLLSNAIKYTDAGGSVLITCRQHAQPIEVQFKDTGIGMTSEAVEQVFERFYRVDEARKKGGTGLGLAIVKQVVELHGGKITLDSILEKGSTFTIVIPIERS